MAGRKGAEAATAASRRSSPEPGLVGGGVEALDPLIHERLRLGILSSLASVESLTFSELRDHLRTTDGNLSIHARRLEEAGYVECRKGFAGRVPRTEYRLAPAGRRALERYLAHMESIIRTARGR